MPYSTVCPLPGGVTAFTVILVSVSTAPAGEETVTPSAFSQPSPQAANENPIIAIIAIKPIILIVFFIKFSLKKADMYFVLFFCKYILFFSCFSG